MSGLSLDLTVARGEAFRLELALEVPPGVTALLGASGSGKSTTLAAVAGLLRPARGRIALAGEVVFDAAAGVDLAPRRRRVGLVPQEGLLFPHLTVRGNLAYGAAGGRSLEEVARALELEPLLERAPSALSGGERQRVALGRALLSHARALLMDEPLAALDRGLRARLVPYLQAVKRGFAGPVLYVTHAVDEALWLADRVCVLHAGAKLSEGAPLEVLGAPRDPRVVALSGFENLLRGRVLGHDLEDQVSAVAVGAHELVVPRLGAAPGEEVCLGLRASDVLLATRPPEGLSARNALPATVTELAPSEPGVEVRLRLRGEAAPELVARLVPSAVRALGVEPGKELLAVVKSSSFASLT